MAGLGDQYGNPFLDAPVEDMPFHGELLPHLAELLLEVIFGKALLPYKHYAAEEHAYIYSCMLCQIDDIAPA